MRVMYRQARIDDLKPLADVVREALVGLEVPHGFDGPSGDADTSFPEFSLAVDPAGLWVAEDNGGDAGLSTAEQRFINVCRPAAF